jgi:hypothetical protein
MNWQNKTLKIALVCIGWASLVSGVGVGIYSVAVLRPQVAQFSERLVSSLQWLDQQSYSLENNQSLLASSLSAVQAGSEIVNLLPKTLVATRGTLLQASDLLTATAITAKKTKDGIAGLVLPKNALGLDIVMIRRTTDQIQLLAGMLNRIKAASYPLAKSTTLIANQLPLIKAEFELMRDRIQSTQNSIIAASLPTKVTLLGLGVSALLMVIGLFSFALAMIFTGIQAIEARAPSSRIGSTERRVA